MIYRIDVLQLGSCCFFPITLFSNRIFGVEPGGFVGPKGPVACNLFIREGELVIRRIPDPAKVLPHTFHPCGNGTACSLQRKRPFVPKCDNSRSSGIRRQYFPSLSIRIIDDVHQRIPRGAVKIRVNSCFTRLQRARSWIIPFNIVLNIADRNKSTSMVQVASSGPRCLIG